MRQSYDTAITQVFAAPTYPPAGTEDNGYGGGYPDPGAYPNDLDATGVIGGLEPGFDDAFARGATARIDFGPHEAFGPPPADEPEPEADDPHGFSLRRIRSHAEARRPKTWIALVVVLGLFAAGAGLRFVPGAPFYPKPATSSTPTVAMPLRPAEITAQSLGTDAFVSWAYVDLRDRSVQGSTNMTEPVAAGSMVLAWLGADFLRRAAEEGVAPTETQLADVDAMIQDNDEAAAERVIALLGGALASFERLGTICQLSDTIPVQRWNGLTISARDAARLGACLGDGRAAGAEWTPRILAAMQQVRGQGDFGIRLAFPADQRPTIAVKNGWGVTTAAGEQQVGCLAVGSNWSLAVLVRLPAGITDTGAALAEADVVCQGVARQLVR
jgi:hypothetical protein